MAYQHKENTGSLFKNDRREKDTHAHAKGTALIDGVEYWVDAWTNEGAKGKYQSLRFTRKDGERKQSYSDQSNQSQGGWGERKQSYSEFAPIDVLNDDIPF